MARGADPEDADLFGEANLAALRAAVVDLSWLLDRGYAEPSATELVGNRYALRRRQREAVRRCACGDRLLATRLDRRVEPAAVGGRNLAVDGFNRLITLEAALAGAPIFRGRDGLLRDIASVHGRWRRVETTELALQRLGEALAALQPAAVTWYLDRPVSRSGALATMLEQLGTTLEQIWRVEVLFDPDGVLRNSSDIVVTADAGVLDHVGAWLDLLPLALFDATIWRIDLGAESATVVGE